MDLREGAFRIRGDDNAVYKAITPAAITAVLTPAMTLDRVAGDRLAKKVGR